MRLRSAATDALPGGVSAHALSPKRAKAGSSAKNAIATCTPARNKPGRRTLFARKGTRAEASVPGTSLRTEAGSSRKWLARLRTSRKQSRRDWGSYWRAEGSPPSTKAPGSLLHQPSWPNTSGERTLSARNTALSSLSSCRRSLSSRKKPMRSVSLQKNGWLSTSRACGRRSGSRASMDWRRSHASGMLVAMRLRSGWPWTMSSFWSSP
mmetsp:Transcript_16874/g.64052  ORF Transcript_16874/g.64052 Transcript_16874/m.64052 type:complete len:209 (+) Transcript_16874:779-1405(+)